VPKTPCRMSEGGKAKRLKSAPWGIEEGKRESGGAGEEAEQWISLAKKKVV